jgi:AAHS family benzoate transporter-like MFS transporter
MKHDANIVRTEDSGYGTLASNQAIDRGVKATGGITKLVVTICWLTILAEGYDLGIYGAVLPALMESNEWTLTPAQAGAIGSYALVGMMLGAIFVGTVTDIIGRKQTLIYCLLLFSVTMALAAMASSPEMFGLYRFIGGIGLGGVIPTASALTIEYSPVNRRSFMYALMYSGYPLGGVLGALLAVLLLEDYGWRLLFWIGALPLLFIPIIVRYLPESISFLLANNRAGEAEAIAKRYRIPLESTIGLTQGKKQEGKGRWSRFAVLFARQNLRATLFFWCAFFMGLLMIYGLNTWLPKLMREAGYPLGSSIAFLLALNVMAAVGAIFGGAAADRWGSQRVIAVSYLLAAVCIGLLSVKLGIVAVYALVGVAGFGTIGSTLILNAYISKYFPSENRATALGWALGFGRCGAISGPIIGGLLLGMHVDIAWNFYMFALAGLLAALAVLLIPKNEGQKI